VPVRKATRGDVPALAAMLNRAFYDDPVVTWMIPNDERRLNDTLGFATWLRRLYLPKDQVYMQADGHGAALWSPPGHWKSPVGKQVAMLPWMVRIFRRRLPLVLKGLTLMEKKHHDPVPHWYLGILGTDPAHQGQGIGSGLLQAVLSRCDREAEPAYLESSKPENVPYYRRHGFEVTEEFELPEGPPVWGMWRDPQ
jgi:GNAT superfamily N-acetyltransferase